MSTRTAAVFYRFLYQLAADDTRLRALYAWIVSAVNQGGGVPAGVVLNYETLAASAQEHINFVVGLQQRAGVLTPVPVPLPRFRILRPGTRETILHPGDLEFTTQLTIFPPPAAPPVPRPTGLGSPLGNPELAWELGKLIVIGGVILLAGYAGKLVIGSLTQEDAKIANARNQSEQQRNYERVLTTATRAYNQCVGTPPTDAAARQVLADRCWATTMARVPALVREVPKVTPPSVGGGSILSWIGSVVLIGGVAVAGVVGYRYLQRRKGAAE